MATASPALAMTDPRSKRHLRTRNSSPAGETAQSLSTLRLAHIAAETGARFVRERIDCCPIDWMLRPLQMFDGRAAISCCGSAEGYRKAMLLHGLSLGMDASPDHFLQMPDADLVLGKETLVSGIRPPKGIGSEWWGRGAPTLFTCTIAASLDETEVQIFCAMIARSEAEVRSRLRQRYGRLFEDEARVKRGFDWSEPLACSLVSDAMANLLKLAAAEPTSSLAQGLDFQVEQRFVG